MIYRELGSTGEKVSAIGLGGFHLCRQENDSESVQLVRSAIDRGITFMDNCWDYCAGLAETRMGKALAGGYRDRVFLMTKIDARTKAAAAAQIDECLAHLQTDRVDMMQFHEIIRLEDPDRIFDRGGAMEAVIEAKRAGKLRFIGFTGHKDPLVHLRMLDVADAHGFAFDAVQMPLNVMDHHFRSFEKDVLPALVQRTIAVLAMKSMGDNFVLNSNTVSPIECLHYSLNLPVSVVITGIDSLKILDQAIQAVDTFRPLTEEKLKSLLARTASAAQSGRFEPFKTTAEFDGTTANPAWMG